MEEKKGWRSVVYEKADFSGVLALFKKHYVGMEVAKADFLRWQYEKNPAGKAVIRLAKNEKGKIVGFYCVLPWWFVINNKAMLGSISLNTLVDEDYRRMGIFSGLAMDCYNDCLKKGVKFTLGFPNPNSYPGYAGRLGFEELMEVPLLIRPLNCWRLVSKKLGLFSVQKIKVTIEPEISKPERVSWPKVVRKGMNTSRRDVRFLDWRTNWPVRDCIVMVQNEAYVVLRTMEVDGVRSGFISDMWFPVGADEMARDLLKRTMDYFSEKSVDLIGCLMVSGTKEYKSLRRSGFWPCPVFLKPQSMRAMLRWHGSKKPVGFMKASNWFLTMLDYDVG